MYSMSHHPPPVNGGLAGEFVEGSGTINPAALDAPAVLPPSTTSITAQSPRGVKRGRSEDVQEAFGGDDEEARRKKRGRPPKPSKVGESPVSISQSLPPSGAPPVQTPRSASGVSQASPPQASPTRVTSSKGPVLKALPTVRDHTTDQLNPEGDEFIPREFDENGEKKVQANGTLLDSREYKCRTFWVPGRGDKLFMLATECARVLGYRDSYLLFNKNRSLRKIIANQQEKDHLISQDILPYSYRSRQIAIVTARSMFRQFGSRVINHGRRVRDDYWEAKARKQGFTEDDPAGEKRPGGARQRAMEAATAEVMPMPHHTIKYKDEYSANGQLESLRTNDNQVTQATNMGEPQYYTSQGYQDRTAWHEMHAHASAASDFNRSLGQQRVARTKYLEDIWHRPHEPPAADPQDIIANPTTSTQAIQSPHVATAGVGQQNTPAHPTPSHNPMLPQAFSQQPGPASMMAQSPVRPTSMQPPMNTGMPQRSPSVSMTPAQQQNFAYQQGGMWHANQAQGSPLGQQHPGMGYPQHMPSPSPVQHSPMHAPQMQHQPNAGSMHAAGMGYPAMQNPAYANMHQRQQMYQPSPSPHQFMQPGAQGNMQGWPQGPQQGQHNQQGQQWGQF